MNLNSYSILKTEPTKKTFNIHIEWFMFSFNSNCFGFVYHNWYPSGGWENPYSSYDYEWSKGFRTYDTYYKDNYIKEDREYAKRHTKDKESDSCFIAKIFYFPLIKFTRDVEKEH